MKLILAIPARATATIFREIFNDIPKVEVINASFEDVAEFDCMVSAANSFGLMDGGVDAAIRSFYGTQLQMRIQKYIIEKFLGEQPVGSAFVIATGNERHPWLAHAPTMRAPTIIAGTDAVYRATWAALLAIYQHNYDCQLNNRAASVIESVVFPAMGAGCGQVAVKSVAAQMKLAWYNFNHPTQSIDWNYVDLRATQIIQAIAK